MGANCTMQCAGSLFIFLLFSTGHAPVEHSPWQPKWRLRKSMKASINVFYWGISDTHFLLLKPSESTVKGSWAKSKIQWGRKWIACHCLTWGRKVALKWFAQLKQKCAYCKRKIQIILALTLDHPKDNTRVWQIKGYGPKSPKKWHMHRILPVPKLREFHRTQRKQWKIGT